MYRCIPCTLGIIYLYITGFVLFQLTDWVWHGDGFVSPNRILIERANTNLSPYVYSLPAEMIDYISMFTSAGAWPECTVQVLLEVLHLVREKYQQIELFDKDEVNSDLRLVLDIINQLKPVPGDTLDPAIQAR